MKNKLTMSLGLLLAGTSALWADAGKGAGPMERLAEGIALIGQGSYDQALTHILWCYDQGVTVDADFRPVRETSVIEALTFLADVHPPTIQALKARRDTALAQAGNPPKVSPAFFDVLALNRVLQEDSMSDSLIQAAVSAGTIQTFATSVPAPRPKIAIDAMKSAEPSNLFVRETKSITDRAKTFATYVKVDTKAQLKNRLDAAMKRNLEDNLSISVKLAEVKKVSSAAMRGRGHTGEGEPMAADTKQLLALEKSLLSALAMAKAESDYLAELKSWNDARAN
jgi:hypothetical protein